MFTLKEELEVAAPAERVWTLLTDFERYPDWNPYILRLETDEEPGSKLTLRIVQPNWKRPLTLHPRLDTFDPRARELRWQGKVGIPLLFDTNHWIRVDRIDDEHSRVVQAERFSGLFCSLLSNSSRRSTRLAFRLMNKSLRDRAEGRDAAGAGD
jgi:hypothetical protein